MTDRCTCHDTLVVKDLNRWFKEKWVDVSRKDKDGKHPPCGRSKAKTSSKGYPKCRPSVKVSSKTPKTSGSMSEGQKRAATKRKRSKKQGVGGKPTIVKQVVVLKRDLSEMTDYEIDRARFANDNQELQSEERTRAMDRMAEYARMNHPPAYALEEMFGEQVADAHDEIGNYDHADYFGDSIDPNEMYQHILENVGEEAAQNYINMYRMHRSQYGGNHASMAQLDAQGMKDSGDVMDFVTNRENLTQDLESMMPTDSSVFDAFPYPEGVEFINHLAPPFTSTPENESNFQMKYAGEPMDMAWRLLKNPVSPEAKRHKLEYDKKYESSPERVKYRSELRRERRHRGIDGKGGPDMSHTKDHTLVAEDPHTNRARHFKERGTLKGDPMSIVWSFLKSDDADYNLYFGGPRNRTAGHYDPLSDTVNINLGAILPTGRSMGFADADADKYTANVLSRINAHEFGHAVTDEQPGVGNLRLSDYGPYSRDTSATARVEHPANIMQYPESALVAHEQLLDQLNEHQHHNAGVKGTLERMMGRRVGEDHPMRGITAIMEQINARNRATVGRDGKLTFHTNTMTPRQKEQRFREIMGLRARNPGLRQANKLKTPEQYDRLIAAERRKDKQRRRT